MARVAVPSTSGVNKISRFLLSYVIPVFLKPETLQWISRMYMFFILDDLFDFGILMTTISYTMLLAEPHGVTNMFFWFCS